MGNSYSGRRLPFLAGVLMMCSLSIASAYSQIDSALSLFPLKPGNIWRFMEYNIRACAAPRFAGYYNKWVEGDTVGVNGRRYQILITGNFFNAIYRMEILRVDSATGNIYAYGGDGFEGLRDSLRASAGDIFVASGWQFQCTANERDTVLGIITTTKRFREIITGGGYTYAYSCGFGLSESSGSWEDPACAWAGVADSLVYAKINGKEYGTYLSVSDRTMVTPSVFLLEQNYPNPFNPSSTIRYGLPDRVQVTLTVFNTLGQKVAVLQNGEQEAGYHEVKFDGSGLSSGVYFYRIEAGSFVQTRKLLLVR